MTRIVLNEVEVETRKMGGVFLTRYDSAGTLFLDERDLKALREFFDEQDSEQMKSVSVEFNALEKAHQTPAPAATADGHPVLTIHVVHHEHGVKVWA